MSRNSWWLRRPATDCASVYAVQTILALLFVTGICQSIIGALVPGAVSADTCCADEKAVSLSEKLAAIQREAVLLEHLGTLWASRAGKVEPTRATFRIDRATTTRSFGSQTPVRGLEEFRPEITFAVESERSWRLQGLSQPLTFVGPNQPANLPEALEQVAARQEYLFQTRRRNAFDPPLRPLWQQPYKAVLGDSVLTQIWYEREDAYPRAVVADYEPENLEAALVAPELLIAEALLLSVSPLRYPLVPVQLDRCKLQAEPTPFHGEDCIVLRETLSGKSGHVRRDLWLLETLDYAVVRAIYHPLNRNPVSRRRQPSEFAEAGDGAVLEIPGERPETLVIDLRYSPERDSSQTFASSVNVSWINSFGGVACFRELSRTSEEPVSISETAAPVEFPVGTWILDGTSGEQVLVEASGSRRLSEEELQDVNEYEQLLPQNFVSKILDTSITFALKRPVLSVVIFWVVVILFWQIGRRIVGRFSAGKLPRSEETPTVE